MLLWMQYACCDLEVGFGVARFDARVAGVVVVTVVLVLVLLLLLRTARRKMSGLKK